ncbi:MAG: DUF6272 family protein [Cyanobacteria bacterium P01_F01_bin.150]
MAQIFGNFRETLPNTREFLLLGFSPSSAPLQKRWRNNGLSANFIADYLTTFFPLSDHHTPTKTRNAEIKDAVSYIANELLENAMKFSVHANSSPIQFNIYIVTENGSADEVTIILSTTNSITQQSVEALQSFINEFLTIDTDELYIRQLERSASDEGSNSGLGFLTIKNDYAAELGWKFETTPLDQSDQSNPEQAAITVTTMVQLKV